ncbi:MAG: hypothetical protein RSA41_07625 [Christensenella sp.]
MKLSDLMKGVTPSPTFVGKTNADDMVLAVNLAATAATTPSGYVIADDGITEQSGALEAITSDKNYLRRGKVVSKTGTSRSFAVNGDRIVGDEFQDAILAHTLKYGTGQAVIKEYVYFNILTGKGEKGKVSIVVEDDLSGAAGEDASFSATLSSQGEPVEYTYVATP